MSERVAVDAITVGERKRPLTPAKVDELVESMGRLGLEQPIVVSRGLRLAAGLHRLAAAKALGWTAIDATVLPFDDPTLLELAEIDENLLRLDLTVLQRSQQLARRNTLLTELGQRAQSGTNVKTLEATGDTVTPVRTTADVAAGMGLSERTAQRFDHIGRAVVPEAQELLAATPVANSTTQLVDLARETPEVQVEAATLIANGEAKSVPDALRRIDPARPLPEPTLGELVPSDSELPPGKLTPMQRVAFAIGRLHVGTKYTTDEMVDAFFEDEAACGDPEFCRRHVEKLDDLIEWLTAIRGGLGTRLSGPRLYAVGGES